jgi:hypothetical protein
MARRRTDRFEVLKLKVLSETTGSLPLYVSLKNSETHQYLTVPMMARSVYDSLEKRVGGFTGKILFNLMTPDLFLIRPERDKGDPSRPAFG